MINLRPVPVVRVLIPFAFGSLAGYTDTPELGSAPLLILSASIGAAAFLFYRFSRDGNSFFHWGFCTSVLLLFFLLGMGTGRIDRPRDPGLPTGSIVLLQGTIEDDPVARNGKLVFKMEIRMAYAGDSLFLRRSLLKVYLPLSRYLVPPVAGETWNLSGRLYPLQSGGNPDEVDYASINKRKNCWYNFYCDSLGLNRRVPGANRLIPAPAVLRSSFSKYWEGEPETRALLSAICLGDRSGLSAELRQSYSMAGGMHVLAVSGLHVGLIWWVLNRLFSFIFLTGKREVFRVALIVLILWVFAYVTGFSSSVSRSVCMFTFYSLSRIMKHRGHPLNAILVSMFFLLLVHPGKLLDLGFQLSYAAIISIVSLHPFFMRLWRPGNSLIRWIWEATGLSLAAQLGTLPLVIYYFHQFPLYGLLSNLVLVPLLSCIITIFVISAPLALSGIGAGIASYLLMKTGGIMNFIVGLVASFPGAVLGGLYIDHISSAILMILLFLLMLILNSRKRAALYIAVVLLCILAVRTATNKTLILRSAETRISHFRSGSLITFRQGFLVDHYILTDNLATINYMDRYISSAWGKHAFELSVILLGGQGSLIYHPGGISCAIEINQGLFLLGNDKVCVAVLSGKYEGVAPKIPGGINPDLILLSDEPILYDTAFLSSFPLVVTDGSDRKRYTVKLQDKALKLYDTASEGAFILHR